MQFRNVLQVYKYQLIEMLMNSNDEGFLDLVWKLCATECAEVE